MKTLSDFLNALAKSESGGKYNAFNKYGYAGKYQMGEMALVDAGYYVKPNRKYNNDWTGKFTGKDNVHSIRDFLNNPYAQENAQLIYKRKQWKYLKAVGAHNYIGKTINEIVITPSGLLAGAHLKGAGSVIKYLKSNGQIAEKDGFGTSVETYIKNFAGFDVSELIR
jgi:hypothetical protein